MREVNKNSNYVFAKAEADKVDDQIIEVLRSGSSFRVEAGAGSGKTYSLNKVIDWIQFDQNGLIPRRLVALLGEISELHMKSFDDVLQLEHITNGYNADYAHPRFIAELLRYANM